MKKLFLLGSITLYSGLYSMGQNYSYDNKAFKTIGWDDFFKKLEKNPNLIYFDIRTDGERNDTSQYQESNQGRIRGAIQIDYFQFEKYYPKLAQFKKDTIYLYCSHSMRSRRLSKQLSDSLFLNVVNINGGISYLNLMGNRVYPEKRKYYETNLKYNIISPFELESKLLDKKVLVVDIRPDSIYYETGGDLQDRSYGYIKGIRHIDFSKINDSISILDKEKEIILVDNYGDISPQIAKNLLTKGFKKVGVLFYGLDQLRNNVPSSLRRYLKLHFPYILPTELWELRNSPDLIVIDIRTETEFLSTDSTAWKNVGRIKNAINIPFSKLTKSSILPYINKRIVIYDNMMMPPELYQAAALLKQFNVKDFSILSGGVFYLKWQIANTKNKYLEALVD